MISRHLEVPTRMSNLKRIFQEWTSPGAPDALQIVCVFSRDLLDMISRKVSQFFTFEQQFYAFFFGRCLGCPFPLPESLLHGHALPACDIHWQILITAKL